MSRISWLVLCVGAIFGVVVADGGSGLGDMCQEGASFCTGPKILTMDNGRIISHQRFNQTEYGPNLRCQWVIIAPKDHIISVQVTYVSIEWSPDCFSDSLTFFNGNGIHNTRAISKVCSAHQLRLINSSSNTMTVAFTTDGSVNKMGFQLRYFFHKRSVATRPYYCGEYDNIREFVQRAWKCDGIIDCFNGRDEMYCQWYKARKCGPTTQNCSNICIRNEDICANIASCPDLRSRLDIPDNATADQIKTPRSGCSEQPIPNVERRIVGGYIARKGSWPWQVSIMHSSGIFCGGSLLNADWIVTAAHCVYNRMNPGDWRVNAGKFLQVRYETTAQTKAVYTVIMHQQYDPRGHYNDIALMKISGSFIFNNYVQPVCVGQSVPLADTQCYITGWGQTQGTGGDGYLKQALVPIVDLNQCNSWYGGSIGNGMLCAGYAEGGTDACQGDSGGPLVCKVNGKYQLMGITSFGNGCAAPQSPGVYTAAPLYYDWIVQSMQDQ